jgi:hypothetical protein
MPFRVTINGLNIECDTSEELQALMTIQNHDRSIGAQRKRHPQWFTSRGKSEFKGNGRRLLEALTNVYPKGVTSSTLAMQLGLDTNALPANIIGLRTRARHAGLNFNQLIKRQSTMEKGMPVSTYQITEEGMKKLQSLP